MSASPPSRAKIGSVAKIAIRAKGGPVGRVTAVYAARADLLAFTSARYHESFDMRLARTGEINHIAGGEPAR